MYELQLLYAHAMGDCGCPTLGPEVGLDFLREGNLQFFRD